MTVMHSSFPGTQRRYCAHYLGGPTAASLSTEAAVGLRRPCDRQDRVPPSCELLRLANIFRLTLESKHLSVSEALNPAESPVDLPGSIYTAVAGCCGSTPCSECTWTGGQLQVSRRRDVEDGTCAESRSQYALCKVPQSVVLWKAPEPGPEPDGTRSPESVEVHSGEAATSSRPSIAAPPGGGGAVSQSLYARNSDLWFDRECRTRRCPLTGELGQPGDAYAGAFKLLGLDD